MPASKTISLVAHKLRTFAVLAVTLIGVTFSAPAQAKTVREALKLNGQRISVPAYAWSDDSVAPRAVLIALHGSVQHAGSFTALAQKLAPQGVIFYSVDLRGHGVWLSQPGKRLKVDYAASSEDVVVLTEQLRQKHNGLPVFLVGESVGAAVALTALSQKPKLFDGLILASPGARPVVGHNWKATLRSIGQGIKTLGGRIDLSHHLKAISDDPRSTDEMLNDPKIRKHASLGDLLHTLNFIKSADTLASKINKNVPVLVIQGNADNIIQSASAEALFAKLATKDKSIMTFPNVGHLLVTTEFMKPEVLTSVEGWLFARTDPAAPIAVTATQMKVNPRDSLLNMPSSAVAEHDPARD